MKYAVTSAKGVIYPEAHRLELQSGALVFLDEQGAIQLAIAPGAWTSVRLGNYTVTATAA